MPKRFGEQLRCLRTRAGLTQTELAERSGVPQSTISQYEQNLFDPSWETVVRLASALGTTPDAFLAPASSTMSSKRK